MFLAHHDYLTNCVPHLNLLRQTITLHFKYYYTEWPPCLWLYFRAWYQENNGTIMFCSSFSALWFMNRLYRHIELPLKHCSQGRMENVHAKYSFPPPPPQKGVQLSVCKSKRAQDSILWLSVDCNQHILISQVVLELDRWFIVIAQGTMKIECNPMCKAKINLKDWKKLKIHLKGNIYN